MHGEDHLKGLTHLGLGGSIPGTLGVGGLAHEEENALPTQLAQTGHVHHVAVNRGEIQLEVARVDDHTQRGIDGQSAGIRDGVVDADELHREGSAQTDHVSRLDTAEVGLPREAVLLKLVLNDAQRQAGGVDGHVQLLEDIGDGSDVILVAVGDDHTADAVAVLLQIGHVGDHQIHTGHLVLVGEADAAVDDDDVLTILYYGHVLAHLVETAQGDDPQLGAGDLLQDRGGGGLAGGGLGSLRRHGIGRHHDGILGRNNGSASAAALGGGFLGGGRGGSLGLPGGLSLGALLTIGALLISLGSACLGLLLGGSGLLGLLLALAAVGGSRGLLLGGSQLTLFPAAGLGGLLLKAKGGENLGGGENVAGADAEIPRLAAALELGGLGLLTGSVETAVFRFVLIAITHKYFVSFFLSVLPYIPSVRTRREVMRTRKTTVHPLAHGKTACRLGGGFM